MTNNRDPHKPNKKRRVPPRLAVDDPTETGPITLRFLGAARTTTGSMHRVRMPKGDLLLDCGMYQGHRAEAAAWNRDLPVDSERVKSVVLSHGHIDHCGALPNLVRMGYRGPIHCTNATADLLSVMLKDSARIQQSDARRLDRKRPRDAPHIPLYTEEDVDRTLDQVVGVPYGTSFEAFSGVEGRFVDAGHIIGSAAVHLTLRAAGASTTLGFTGDLGRKDVPILRDPEPLGNVDWYITESTYGDRDHENTGDLMTILESVVLRAVKRGGKLLIPAFAVGRTQLVLYLLHKLREADRIPDIPFYVDSPMASKATEVYRRHRKLYDDEAQRFLMCEGALFHRARTSIISNVEESKALNLLDGSAVIISSSGMCEGGRILHHLKNHATDRRNLVLFVGYQAMHTLGRRILEGHRDVKIYGEKVHIAAEVRKINGLSAHADRHGLLRYANSLENVPKKMFLVHGDDERIEALRGFFRDHGLRDTTSPEPGEWHRLV